MSSRRVDKREAQRIARLRNEGKTDQQIVADHGSDKLSAGYRWLEANPGVDPLTDTAKKEARPARGAGAHAVPIPVPSAP